MRLDRWPRRERSGRVRISADASQLGRGPWFESRCAHQRFAGISPARPFARSAVCTLSATQMLGRSWHGLRLPELRCDRRRRRDRPKRLTAAPPGSTGSPYETPEGCSPARDLGTDFSGATGPKGKGSGMRTHGRRGSRASVAGMLLLLVAGLALAACGGSGDTASSSPSAMTSPSVAASPSATPLPAPTVAGTIAVSKVTEGCSPSAESALHAAAPERPVRGAGIRAYRRRFRA